MGSTNCARRHLILLSQLSPELHSGRFPFHVSTLQRLHSSMPLHHWHMDVALLHHVDDAIHSEQKIQRQPVQVRGRLRPVRLRIALLLHHRVGSLHHQAVLDLFPPRPRLGLLPNKCCHNRLIRVICVHLGANLPTKDKRAEG